MEDLEKSSRSGSDNVKSFRIVVEKDNINEIKAMVDRGLKRGTTSSHLAEYEFFNSLVSEAKKFIYHPGDIVRGHVDLELNPSKEIHRVRELKVTLNGKMDLLWYEVAEGDRARPWPRSKTVSVHEQEVVVWTPKNISFGGTLDKDFNRFDFEFQLPATMLGSFSTTFIRARCIAYYYIDAIVVAPDNTFHADSVAPVYIERQLFSGSSCIPDKAWDEPASHEKSHFTSCSGFINAEVKLRNGIFLEDGKPIVIDFTIENNSLKAVRKIKCRIKQKLDIFENGKLRMSPDAQTVCGMKTIVNIPGRRAETFSLCLPLPEGQEATIHKNDTSPLSSFIHIKYWLEVEVFTGHWSMGGPAFKFEVIVGTKGVDGEAGVDNSLQVANDGLIVSNDITMFKKCPLHGIRQLLVGEHFHVNKKLLNECSVHAGHFH